MPRIDPGDLPDPEAVFIAGTLRLARAVEEWLTTAGAEYAVEVEPLGRSLLFGSLRMGAAFYVAGGDAEHWRARLSAAGFTRGIVESAEE
jgi:hypothetical protein